MMKLDMRKVFFRPASLRMFLPWVLLLAGLVWSCSSVKSGVAPSKPTQLATNLLNSIERRNEAVHSFAARGEIIISVKGREYRGRQTMAAILPDYFLVQISTPANAPILSIASDGESVTIVDFTKEMFTSTPIKDGRFALASSLWLHTNYFTMLPVGDIPLVPRPSIREAIDRKKQEAKLILNQQGLSETILTIISTLTPPFLVKDITRTQYGSEDYHARFRLYTTKGNVKIPMYVLVEMPQKRSHIIIRHRQLLLNPELEPEQFQITPPGYFMKVESVL
jgi:hypothetical protein